MFTGVDAARERGFLKRMDAKEVRNGLEEGLGTILPGLDFKGYEFHQTDASTSPSRSTCT